MFVLHGCEKRTNQKLQIDIRNLQNTNQIYQETNQTNQLTIDLCKKELRIAKASYQTAKDLELLFTREIKRFPKLAETVDNVEDPIEQFELRKQILQDIISGKNAIQIYKQLRSKCQK